MLSRIKNEMEHKELAMAFLYVIAFVSCAIYIYKEFILFNNIVSIPEKFLFYSLFYLPLLCNIGLTENESTKRLIIHALFLFYVMAAINVLFIDDIFDRHFFIDFYYSDNPIRNMKFDFSELFSRKMFFHNVMNVILLFPAGCFSYYLYKLLRNPWLYTYIFVITDVCIEALQFVFAVGVFDVCDIITNLFGVFLAYVLASFIEKIVYFTSATANAGL